MKEYCYTSHEEAKRKSKKILAANMLRKGYKPSECITTKTAKSSGVELLILEDREGNAFFIREGKKEAYYLTAEETDTTALTFPYTNFATYAGIYFFLIMGGNYCKPSGEMTARQAQTPEGMERLYTLYCRSVKGYETSIAKAKKRNWKEWNTETDTPPSPHLIEQLTGVRPTTAHGYLIGMQAMAGGRTFTDTEQEDIERDFLFNQTQLFLLYLLYNFSRTEEYATLQEALNDYSAFLLPDKWEENSLFLDTVNATTAEEYVLARYLYPPKMEKIGAGLENLRNIAEYTGVPYKTLRKAAKKRNG